MRLATWNVNGVRAREALVADWLDRTRPDLLLLQEVKCEAAAFPAERFEALGYASEVVGQKGYNGVAVLSREPVEVTARSLPGCEDQARYLEVEAGGVRVGNLYLPNGNSGGEAGYGYKLRFMDALAGGRAPPPGPPPPRPSPPPAAAPTTRCAARRAAPRSAACSGSA